MPHRHASALDVMSKAENYNNWINNTIKPSLGNRILEIGCGIGNFTKFLKDADLIVCIDQLASCIEKTRAAYGENKNIKYVLGDFLDQKIINDLAQNKFDTIVCLNVLEHIKDDHKAIDASYKILSPGGKLILMVPAMGFIYGSIDESLGHERRYNKPDLKIKLEKSGFKIKELKYLNSIGILGWLINNKLLKKKELSLSQALFYDRFVIPILSKIESFFAPPFGMSLIAIAEK